MPACASCGRDNPADARYCNSCGAPLSRWSRHASSARWSRSSSATSSARPRSASPPIPRRCARGCGATSRICARSSSATAARSRSSSATRSWPSSGSRSRTRTMRCAPFGPLRRCARSVAEHRARGTDRRQHRRGRRRRRGRDARHRRRGQRGRPARAGGGRGRDIDRGRDAGARPRCRHGRARRALTLKGKSEPVEAYRLLEVHRRRRPARTPSRRRRSSDASASASGSGATTRTWSPTAPAGLFTLLGPAGIGKSRLVADFLERVGDSADVLRGRCLSYGEGITYWPLVEILVAIGVEPDSVDRHVACPRRSSRFAGCSKPAPPSDRRSS